MTGWHISSGTVVSSLTAEAALAKAVEDEAPRRVRHKARGTTYEVLGEAEAQVSNGRVVQRPVSRKDDTGLRCSMQLVEGDNLVVYRCEQTGKLWCRRPEEFEDGRFEDIAYEAAKAAPGEAASDLYRRIRDCWDEDECPSWNVVEPLVAMLVAASPAPPPDAVRLSADDDRLLNKALSASTETLYEIALPPDATAAGGVAVKDMQDAQDAVEHLNEGDFYADYDRAVRHVGALRRVLALVPAAGGVDAVITDAMIDAGCAAWVNLYPAFKGEKPPPTAGDVVKAILTAALASPAPSETERKSD